jgi:hypothetical protein
LEILKYYRNFKNFEKISVVSKISRVFWNSRSFSENSGIFEEFYENFMNDMVEKD